MFGECHAHIFMNGYNYRKAVETHKDKVNERIIGEHLAAYEKEGITFLRDGGDALGVSDACRHLAKDYGIDYRTPIYAIHKTGYYGGIVGRGFHTRSEYEELVANVKARGGDFIKIMVSGIVDFSKKRAVSGDTLPEHTIETMIEIAHKQGMSVMVHANGEIAVKAAAKAKADTIEHGRFITKECLEIMAENKVVWVPTLVTVKNLKGCGRFPDDAVESIYSEAVEDIKTAYACGVQMAIGSDAGAYQVYHGTATVQEYGCFQEILGAGDWLDAYLEKGETRIQQMC
ncbi:MAG: amidohydrolase family protein [Lachnospiraceae bacterium]|nr:amidohydrolase family protein [Lachnospiraceae bacterium]MDD3616476.1 amidohydrolase family protein [Lachnospiraceae bacterium]